MAAPAPTDAEQAAELRRRADATVDASVDATRRMVQAAEESRQAGGRTLGMLDEQGARLDQLDHRFDTVQNNLEESQRQLTLFERATCSMCGRRRRHKDASNDMPMAPVAPAAAAPATATAASAGRPASTASKSPASSGAPAASAPMRRIVNDEREDEMAANLDVVGDILADLRLQSQQMGETLDAQNDRLAQLNGKADTNLGLVANVNKRTTALL